MLGGICKLDLRTVSRVYRNEMNVVEYMYINQEPKTGVCCELIPAGETMHQGSHQCAVALRDHKCMEQCPDCSCYCTLPPGHSGLHSSNTHRNKERCIYISTNTVVTKEIEDINEVVTTKKFSPGESATPEHCDANCLRNGRGHVHPRACEGGTRCLEMVHKGFAKHSQREYFSGGVVETCRYDLVECSTYWRIFGWEAPVATMNQEAQKVLNKCNAICSHDTHKENVYCKEQIFHTDGVSYGDHSFECTHNEFETHDIIFVVDITQSMTELRDPVRETIKELISKWVSYDTKFGFVGYTDHGSAIGEYLEGLGLSKPVLCYPKDKDICQFNLEQLIKTIDEIIFAGGGGNGGEAMIDGLSEASQFKFRKNARQIFVIIADEAPHGKEFDANSDYPDGCPCGISWKGVLKIMKDMNSQILFVKLSDLLNTTYNLFKECFENKIYLTSLAEATSFQLQMVKKISILIQTDLEFSCKFKPT